MPLIFHGQRHVSVRLTRHSLAPLSLCFPVNKEKDAVKYTRLDESLQLMTANGDVTNSEDDSDVDVFNVRRDRIATSRL